MNKMNPEVKKLWLEALPNYEQGKSCLRHNDKFCCLGVLCDIHSKTFGNTWGDEFSHYQGNFYMGEEAVLPVEVRDWAGLPKMTGAIVNIKGQTRQLTEHNDLGCTFEEIAKAIEEQL